MFNCIVDSGHNVLFLTEPVEQRVAWHLGIYVATITRASIHLLVSQEFILLT